MLTKENVKEIILKELGSYKREIYNPSFQYVGYLTFNPSNVDISIKINGQLGIKFNKGIILQNGIYTSTIESVVVHIYMKNKNISDFMSDVVDQIITKIFVLPNVQFSSNGAVFGCTCFDRRNREKDVKNFIKYVKFLLKYLDDSDDEGTNLEKTVGMVMEYLRFDYVIGRHMEVNVRNMLCELIVNTSLHDHPDLAFCNEDTLYFRVNYELAPFVIEKVKDKFKRVRKTSSPRIKLVSSLLV